MQTSYALETRLIEVTPRAGLDYVRLLEPGFAEAGAGAYDLAGKDTTTDSLRPFIGATVTRRFVTSDGTALAPELGLTYSHEVASVNRTITLEPAGTGVDFVTSGVAPSRDNVTLSTGLTVRARATLDLYVDYDAELHAGNHASQTISAGLQYRFN